MSEVGNVVWKYLHERSWEHLQATWQKLSAELQVDGEEFNDCADNGETDFQDDKGKLCSKIIYYEQCKAQKELKNLMLPACDSLSKWQVQIRYELANAHQITEYWCDRFLRTATKRQLWKTLRKEYAHIAKIEGTDPYKITVRKFLTMFPQISNFFMDPVVQFRFSATDGWDWSNAQKKKISQIMAKYSTQKKGNIADVNTKWKNVSADGEAFEMTFNTVAGVFGFMWEIQSGPFGAIATSRDENGDYQVAFEVLWPDAPGWVKVTCK